MITDGARWSCARGNRGPIIVASDTKAKAARARRSCGPDCRSGRGSRPDAGCNHEGAMGE
jgi:hypothetical protein